MKGRSIVESLMDFMELMKSQPRTRAELAEQCDITLDTSSRWVSQLVRGVFIKCVGFRASTSGKRGQMFMVTKQWGGNEVDA